jgi:hypothetical protein
MGALLIILLLTTGLAVRAGPFGGPGNARAPIDAGLFDACARTLVLVILSLVGLFALGVLYGNVLGPDVVTLASVK